MKECDNPLPTRGIRGLVVDGVYRCHPLAGGREHHFPPRHQPDGEHLAGGRKRAGGHVKRRPKTHSRGEQDQLEAHGVHSIVYVLSVPCDIAE